MRNRNLFVHNDPINTRNHANAIPYDIPHDISHDIPHDAVTQSMCSAMLRRERLCTFRRRKTKALFRPKRTMLPFGKEMRASRLHRTALPASTIHDAPRPRHHQWSRTLNGCTNMLPPHCVRYRSPMRTLFIRSREFKGRSRYATATHSDSPGRRSHRKRNRSGDLGKRSILACCEIHHEP